MHTPQNGSLNSSPQTDTKTDKELTLRLYQARDIPCLIDMIMNAVPQLPNYAILTPDRVRIKYLLDHNIQNAYSFCGWVVCDSHDVPRGCGAAWCVMSLVSQDIIADDAFLWIEPEYRTYRSAAMLFNAYLEWAKARKAKLIRASHTGGSFPKDTKEGKLFDALLRRMGFKEVGSVYHYTPRGDN
jgi:GNAT superfamily N-acetyltransferase